MIQIALFSAGCFWCIQAVFDSVEGVLATSVGYTGGNTPNPSYEDVCRGKTGHLEAIQVIFESNKISYEELLSLFWRNIDPTAKARQFCDVGHQYQTAIFYTDETQHQLAELSKAKLKNRFTKLETLILPAGPFFLAESEHQKFYLKQPERYQLYSSQCGREELLKELWD